jgi:hypothetical protein
MPSDHRVILHLLAQGRITPAEAERLFIANNEGREFVWMLSVCIAITVLTQVRLRELLPGLLHLAHSLLPAASLTFDRTQSFFNHVLGGIR